MFLRIRLLGLSWAGHSPVNEKSVIVEILLGKYMKILVYNTFLGFQFMLKCFIFVCYNFWILNFFKKNEVDAYFTDTMF